MVDFQTTLSSYLNTLTKTEKIVADYVLANMEETMYLTVTELAEKAGVSETTVLRFCRKIGFKGYQSFKLAVTKECAKQEREMADGLEELSALQALVQQSTDSSIQAIKETASLMDTEELEKAIELIFHAKRIAIFGSSVSGNTAQDARNRFLRIGVVVEASADTHLQAMSAATLNEGDVAIGISASGSTKDTINALEIAKEKGAKVIVLTHSRKSPITSIADCVLLTSGRETPLQGGSMGAKISQLLIIDMLYNGVASQLKEKSTRMRELTSKAVVDKAY